METFGNTVTAQAVASGTPASEVGGVAIDHHDQQTPVVVAAARVGIEPRAMTGMREFARRYLPVQVRRTWRRLNGQQFTPPPGAVRCGDLRRTTPIASDFGYSRGGPVDRYYIESFLEQHHLDVRGRVLEVGDSTYTNRFGGARVTHADVLHIKPDTPGATFIGDLADGSFLPDDAFDCVVLTQTLHLVYDFAAALRTIARVLAPGGVLLMTVPGSRTSMPPSGGRPGTTRSLASRCNACVRRPSPASRSR